MMQIGEGEAFGDGTNEVEAGSFVKCFDFVLSNLDQQRLVHKLVILSKWLKQLWNSWIDPLNRVIQSQLSGFGIQGWHWTPFFFSSAATGSYDPCGHSSSHTGPSWSMPPAGMGAAGRYEEHRAGRGRRGVSIRLCLTHFWAEFGSVSDVGNWNCCDFLQEYSQPLSCKKNCKWKRNHDQSVKQSGLDSLFDVFCISAVYTCWIFRFRP